MSGSSVKGKIRKRTKIDLETKMEIIREHESQQNLSAVARAFGLSVSTVNTIIRDSDRIKEYVKGSTLLNATVITKRRSGAIHEMEEILILWIEEQMHNRVPFTMNAIQEKARSIYKEIEGKYQNEIHTFSASKGWVHRFKVRAGLQGIRFTGDNDDMKVAQAFISSLNKKIDEGNYKAEQIFGVIDVGLFWKRLPERALLSSEAATDKLTLLLGGNVSGDCKLKPLMVYHEENPRMFEGINRKNLPVFYCYDRRVWISVPLFEDWFINCFVPEVEKYCTENNIPFKILLLMDDSPGRPKYLNDFHPDVEVVFLPQNTYSQPMNQSILSCFRAHYLLQLIAYVLSMVNDHPGKTVRNVLDSYEIYQGILNIGVAWDTITQDQLNCCWSKLCPRFAQENPEDSYEFVIDEIVQTANRLDLKMGADDLDEYIVTHWNDSLNRDLIKVEPINVEEVHEEDDNLSVFSLNEMTLAFSEISSALKKFKAMDPDESRYSKVQKQINNALSCYKEIYNEARKHHSEFSLIHWPKSSTSSFKPS